MFFVEIHSSMLGRLDIIDVLMVSFLLRAVAQELGKTAGGRWENLLGLMNPFGQAWLRKILNKNNVYLGDASPR